MSSADRESLKQELLDARHQVARLQQSLVESQRLATVGELACRVIHEFNNILMLIIGRAGEAIKYDDPAMKEKALRKTVESGKRAADIAAGLLGYACGRQTQNQLIPADALMDAAVALTAWDLPKCGIQLLRQYETTVKVRVVPGRMEQVLLNLILNARSAMRDRGGMLTVAVVKEKGPGPLTTLGVLDPFLSYVALKVQDTGCGIPPEHLEKIFDPFFTTRPRTNGEECEERGTGLGLPVARDLVRQAGGEIHVASTPGAGSTFSVLLPIAE